MSINSKMQVQIVTYPFNHWSKINSVESITSEEKRKQYFQESALKGVSEKK